jgi:thiamine kinase-like enzyme
MTLFDPIRILRLVQVLAQRSLARFYSKGLNRDQGVCLEVDGISLSEVRQFRVSKPGNVIFVGKLGNQRVKICQVFSAAQARFIQRVCELPRLQEYFPRVLHRKGRYIITEWINGKPLTRVSLFAKPELLEQLVRMQATLHTHQLPSGEAGFDYVQFLEKRLDQFRAILPLPDGLAQILDTVRTTAPSAILRLSHPDISLGNVVIQKGSGKLKSVDNELLTQSPCYLIDLFNTYYRLRYPRQLGTEYVHLYREHIPELKLLEGWDSYLLALWGLRLIGALFQAGDFSLAYRVSSQIVAGELDDHPVIEMLREEVGK